MLVYNIRNYDDGDLDACAECLRDGFFTNVNETDMGLLRDYMMVLAAKCSFTLVAECGGDVVGFLCGGYKGSFDRKLARTSEQKRHYGRQLKALLKFALRMYPMSPGFREELDMFFARMRERPRDVADDCDCELFGLASKKDFRKGVGTALMNGMMMKCRAAGASRIRVVTNTVATYKFYDKFGECVYEKGYTINGQEGRTMVYEIPASIS